MRTRNRFEFIETHRQESHANVFKYGGVNWTCLFGDSIFSETNKGRVSLVLHEANGESIQSFFRREKLLDRSYDTTLFLYFESAMLAIDDNAWTSKIPGLVSQRVIAVTPSEYSFDTSKFSDKCVNELQRYDLNVDDVKDSFADFCRIILAGIGLFKIGDNTNISLSTDSAITYLIDIADNYYAKTRSTSNIKMLRPTSSTTFTLQDRGGHSHTFGTQYYISIKSVLAHVTPFIKEMFGCKNGVSAYIQPASITKFMESKGFSTIGESNYSWYVQFHVDSNGMGTVGNLSGPGAADTFTPGARYDLNNFGTDLSCDVIIQFNVADKPFVPSEYISLEGGDVPGSRVCVYDTGDPVFVFRNTGDNLLDYVPSKHKSHVSTVTLVYTKHIPNIVGKHYRSSSDALIAFDDNSKNCRWQASDDAYPDAFIANPSHDIPIKYNTRELSIDLLSKDELAAAGRVYFFPRADAAGNGSTYKGTVDKRLTVISHEDKAVEVSAKVERIPDALRYTFLDGGYRLAQAEISIVNMVNLSSTSVLVYDGLDKINDLISDYSLVHEFLTGDSVVYKCSSAANYYLPLTHAGGIARAVVMTPEGMKYSEDCKILTQLVFSAADRGLLSTSIVVGATSISDDYDNDNEFYGIFSTKDLVVSDTVLSLTTGSIGVLCDSVLDVSDDNYALSSLIASYLVPDPEIISPTLTADSLSTLSDSLRDNTSNLLYKIEDLLLSDDGEIDYDDEDIDNYMASEGYYYVATDGTICVTGVSDKSRHPMSALVPITSLSFDVSDEAVGLPFYDEDTHELRTTPFTRMEDMNTVIKSTNEDADVLLWQLIVRAKCITLPSKSDETPLVDLRFEGYDVDFNQFVHNDLDDIATYVDKVVDVYGTYLEETFVNAISSSIDSLADNVPVSDSETATVQEAQLLSNAINSVDITSDKLLASLENDETQDIIGRASVISQRLSAKAKAAAKSAAAKVKGTIQDTYTRLGTIKTNVSMKVQALSEAIASAATNATSSLLNLLGLGSDSTVSTGWADADDITNTNALAISIDVSTPLKAVASVCKTVGSILDKGVNWLYGKAKSFIDETFVDGVSFKVNTAGYETLDLAQYQERYTTEQFLLQYNHIGDYFYKYCEYRGLTYNIMMVYQVNSVLTFIQRLDKDTWLVSSNVLLDLGSNYIKEDASDLDFIDQMVYAQNRAIRDYNTFVDIWNGIAGVLNQYYPDVNAHGLSHESEKDRDQLYSKIFSGAFVVSIERTTKKVKAWGWFAVALGAVIACTGVGAAAGAAIAGVGAAAIVGASIAESNVHDYDINKVVAKAREDSSYANKEITAAEIKGCWLDFPTGIFVVYNEMINDVLFPSGYVHAGQGRTITCHDANGVEYQGYIPMAIVNGAPTFKYHIYTDNERRAKAWVRVAGIVAVSAAFVVGAMKITKGLRMKHKYKKLCARQWSLENELKAKYAKKGKVFDSASKDGLKAYNKAQGKLSWKLNKTSNALGGGVASSALSSALSSNNEDVVLAIQERIG